MWSCCVVRSWKAPRNASSSFLSCAAWVPIIANFATSLAIELPYHDCLQNATAGHCLKDPVNMWKRCPGSCEEDQPNSTLRRRTVFENVVTEAECQAILDVERLAGFPGDGYQGNAFPYGPAVHFSGVTPVDAASWAVQQKGQHNIDEAVALVQTLLSATERVRTAVQDHFVTLDASAGHLEFDFVQVNCREGRSVIDPADVERSRLRSLYADNCWQNGETSCVRSRPFFWWRTYSAVLFLDLGASDLHSRDGFFYAADFKGQRRTAVSTRCGHVAAYDAGAANIHGAEPPRPGKQPACQLAVFLTNDTSRAMQPDILETAADILDGKVLPASLFPDDWQSALRHYDEYCPAAAARLDVSGLPMGIDGDVPVETIATPLTIDGLPMRVVEVVSEPQLTLIENFLSKEEIDHLHKLGDVRKKRSVIFEGDTLVRSDIRRSSSAWLSEEDDPIVTRVERRIARLTGLALESAEELQIAFYEASEKGNYEPHLDWGFGSGKVTRTSWTYGGKGRTTKKTAGARVATFLMYLEASEVGGHTLFTELNVSFLPRAGMAVFWFNLLPDRGGDVRVRHGACPVLSGRKVIATKWFHEAENSHLFLSHSSTDDSLQRSLLLRRDWSRVAAEVEALIATNNDVEDDAPSIGIYLPESCAERQSRGHCDSEPTWMAEHCFRFCPAASHVGLEL